MMEWAVRKSPEDFEGLAADIEKVEGQALGFSKDVFFSTLCNGVAGVSPSPFFKVCRASAKVFHLLHVKNGSGATPSRCPPACTFQKLCIS